MSERKAVIKNADMSEDMQQDAIDCATQVSLLLQVAPAALIWQMPCCRSMNVPCEHL